MTARPGDRGSATVLATVLVGASSVAVLLGLAAASVLVDNRRAQAAADLAALAGATALQRSGDACAAAARIASENGADLLVCERSASTVLVAVVVETRVLHLVGAVEARARAGTSGQAAPGGVVEPGP